MANNFLTNIRFQTLIVFCGFPFAGISQPDIPMNAELKSNSESWHVKIKQSGIWGSKPAQVNFGPVKTIVTEAGKTLELSREVDRELLMKNIHSVSSKESRMELVINETDSVQIHMLTMEEEEIKKRNTVGTISNAETGGNEMYHSSSWIRRMILSFSADSSSWVYFTPDTGTAAPYAILENTRDSSFKIEIVKINNLEGKNTKEIMFTQPALGFGFRYQGKDIAAFQTLLKQSAWISKAIDPKLRPVILATTAALFATFKSGNPNGF